jgi:hypothetical protein
MQSCVLLIPANLKAKANALSRAMGWADADDDSYSVPLSASGAEPASHYGLHSWVDDAFVGMLQGASQGQMPAPLVAAGYPPADFAAVVGALIVSLGGEPGPNFAGACERNGLKLVA